MNNKLDKLNRILGSPFSDLNHLEMAITHRSAGSKNNERMEFLGDAILGFVISDNLYRKFPTAREGQLSRLRAKLVKRDSLAGIARELGIGEYLIMGSGELKSGGYKRSSILSDAFEAILAALYEEQGLEVVRERLEYWFSDLLQNLTLDDTRKDPKTRLQEYLQSRGMEIPDYSVVSIEGQAPEQIFKVRCSIQLLPEASIGVGDNRRQAEQIAANLALERLNLTID